MVCKQKGHDGFIDVYRYISHVFKTPYHPYYKTQVNNSYSYFKKSINNKEK